MSAKRQPRIAKACLLTLLICLPVQAQEGELIVDNVFRHFRQPADGWLIAEAVNAVDGKKELQVTPKSHGTGGILVNGTEHNKKAAYLFTKQDYQDVAVHLEFMVPKDSNSGVYLMGRYEIQILDSFGKEQVNYGDLGGVYQRWRDAKTVKATGLPAGYEGVSPMVNAAKAPGEWQELDIVFRAPRFCEAGTKTEKAKFIAVHVNGKLVQANVEVSGPTRAAQFSDEVARGPVVIQGDHGPIAIRSFRVKPVRTE